LDGVSAEDLLEGVRHGHAAVIELALQVGVPRVVIDERRGRRAALAVGLQVTGTLGLLGREGARHRSRVRPFMEGLRS